MKIKVGIFFGGPSREREISFAGGRTVYDNLNKSVFEALPIFVDSHRNLILLDWQYIYKGTIRDFYPPVAAVPSSPHHWQIYLESLGELSDEQLDNIVHQVGRRVNPEELPQLINVAFLALHGEYGEDGQLQKELADLRIPYTGSGVRACQIGMDKAWQKELMAAKGFATPTVTVLDRKTWHHIDDVATLYQETFDSIGSPVVIRPANQGSSIGVSIIDRDAGVEAFREAIDRAFFREFIPLARWRKRSTYEKVDHIRLLTDIRDGLGFPLDVVVGNTTTTIYHPEKLLTFLDEQAEEIDEQAAVFELNSHLSESKVILEEFISGKEFSCIVVRTEDGGCLALPPTEIVKGGEVFDYRSKYMPGRSRKETPIALPNEKINAIRTECERLFSDLGFQTYARIDGFITPEDDIFLNDPNTTSGMLPSSFFFHQAAEIGLNPSQFLSFIIRTSVQERVAEHPEEAGYQAVLSFIDEQLQQLKEEDAEKKKIGIILGGYSFERHISVESGRNIYEKLASSENYLPVPIFLSGLKEGEFELYQLPVSLLLKDNADDIRDKIKSWRRHPVVEEIKEAGKAITQKYAAQETVFSPQQIAIAELPQLVDQVFIALHGRPGEDGSLQAALDHIGLTYNGSGATSSAITINKYQTLQTLKRNGFPVTQQLLMKRSDFESDPNAFYRKAEETLVYPLIAKPVDDGCSSAVMVLNKRDELEAYCQLMFRPHGATGEAARKVLRLSPKEEFPVKEDILFEERITANGASRFLEITGGLLTHVDADGNVRYEVFEPSEALSSGEVLSVEEKFLAGEGQNITPARFADREEDYEEIAGQVKRDLERAARILNVQGYARIDAFVRIFPDNSVETIIVEVNSLPGMTPATAIFHQAALQGYQPHQFIDRILDFARQHHAITHAAQNTPETMATAPDSYSEDEFINEEKPPTEAANSAGNALLERLKQFGRETWAFLKSPIFLKNLAVLVVFLGALFFLLKGSLNLYTHHGEKLEVHDYRGMTVQEARKKARQRSFSIVIMDSVFLLNQPPNQVIAQDPRPFSQVKQNRSIYLTVTRSTPPDVPLPSLIGSDEFEQYRRKLERLDIELTVHHKKFDRKLEENTILYLVIDGKRYQPGNLENGKVKVPRGSTIGAVITIRDTGQAQVPNLVCLRFSEASFNITGRELVVGRVEGAGSNPENYFVWKQEPPAGTLIDKGQPVNLYLQASRPKGCE